MRELFPNLRRILFAVTIFTIMLALGLIAVSCGKSGKSLVSSVNQSGTGGSPVDFQNDGMDGYPTLNGDRVAMSVAGPLGGEFVFEPLDGDGTPDKKGEAAYQLKLKPGDGEGGSGSGGGDFGTRPTIELTITAKKNMGNSWKYALGYIEYDPEKYNPIEFIPGDLFGDDEKDVLNAALFQEKGRIAFWCGLKNFDKKDAKPGGEIGTFVIELVPWEPPRDARSAPDDLLDSVFWLEQLYPEDHVRILFWSEVNRGDGDINGEVYISDLTPLAQYDGYTVANPSELDVVDYDDNNEISCDIHEGDYLEWLNGASPQFPQLDGFECINGYRITLSHVDHPEDPFIFNFPGPTWQQRNWIRLSQIKDPYSIWTKHPNDYFKSKYGSVLYWWHIPDFDDFQNRIPGGQYEVRVSPYDNINYPGTPSTPIQIILDGDPWPEPGNSNNIRISSWRINDLTPTLDDRFGESVMQYGSLLNYAPYLEPYEGYVCQVTVSDTTGNFCNLNAVRLYMDLIEPEGTQNTLNPGHVFEYTSFIPYDGCFTESSPKFRKWYYIPEELSFATAGPEEYMYRLNGFLDSHHYYHDPELGENDFAVLVFLDQGWESEINNPELVWRDIHFNHADATTETTPLAGEERIFDIFFKLKEYPAPCDGMTLWFQLDRPDDEHYNRSYYSSISKVKTDFTTPLARVTIPFN